MKRLGRRLARPVVHTLEEAYHRLRPLRRVSPVLLVEKRSYRGAPRRLDADVTLEPGDPIGILHFDNRALQRTRDERADTRPAFAFARLFLRGLHALAEQVRRGDPFGDIAAFHGVSWIPPHGRRLGFQIEPLPDTWRTRLRGLYFRLLLEVFAPESSEKLPGPIRPQAYWLSRRRLLENFQGRERPR